MNTNGSSSNAEDLDSLNEFLLDVGQKIKDDESSYEGTNAMLRDLHLGRLQRAGGRQNEKMAIVSVPLESDGSSGPPLIPSGAKPIIRSRRRSAAQRLAAERLVQPTPPSTEHRAAPAALIGCEDFYRHQQEGIRAYRRAYDARVGAHYEALAMGKSALPGPRPTDAIGALAHEHASQHVAPISELVHAASSHAPTALAKPPPLGFTSEKTAGRRGGRAGRSGSIQAALQAAKDRGPILSDGPR